MLRPIAFCLISAFLLILSFPTFNLSFLAWFALVPLFFAIQDKKPSQSFILGYITGFIFYLGSIYWLIHVTLPGLILVSAYLALYFGVFALFVNGSASNDNGTPYAVRCTLYAAPAAWVALEYLRTNFPTGFGWNLLCYSQSTNLPIIQIADITGCYGVSFLIVMVNVALYGVISSRIPRKFTVSAEGGPASGGYSLQLFICFLCVALALGYGYFRLSRPLAGDSIKISLIQGNIPQHEKWDAAYEKAIFDKYAVLTKIASAEKPALIIWPETAFPGYFGSDEDLTEDMLRLAKNIRIPLLFGTPLIRGLAWEDGVTNSAVLLDADGNVLQKYDKLHLVPFGEYIPFEKYLGFVHNFAHYPIAGFAPGSKCTIFPMPAKFAVLVCFEDIFPSLVRKFVRNGAQLMVNITNDAWFKETSAPYQHAQASVFRAVENRVSVVRSANTGLSCHINPKGQIISRVQDEAGKDIFIDGYVTRSIQVSDKKSFYVRHGDIFSFLCAGLFLFIFLKKR